MRDEYIIKYSHTRTHRPTQINIQGHNTTSRAYMPLYRDTTETHVGKCLKMWPCQISQKYPLNTTRRHIHTHSNVWTHTPYRKKRNYIYMLAHTKFDLSVELATCHSSQNTRHIHTHYYTHLHTESRSNTYTGIHRFLLHFSVRERHFLPILFRSFQNVTIPYCSRKFTVGNMFLLHLLFVSDISHSIPMKNLTRNVEITYYSFPKRLLIIYMH